MPKRKSDDHTFVHIHLAGALLDHLATFDENKNRIPIRRWNHFHVFYAMIQHTDLEHYTFFVGQRTIAKETGLSERTVKRIYIHFQYWGLITKSNRNWRSGQRVYWHVNIKKIKHLFDGKPKKPKAVSRIVEFGTGDTNGGFMSPLDEQKAVTPNDKSGDTKRQKRCHEPPNLAPELRTNNKIENSHEKNFTTPSEEWQVIKRQLEGDDSP